MQKHPNPPRSHTATLICQRPKRMTPKATSLQFGWCSHRGSLRGEQETELLQKAKKWKENVEDGAEGKSKVKMNRELQGHTVGLNMEKNKTTVFTWEKKTQAPISYDGYSGEESRNKDGEVLIYQVGTQYSLTIIKLMRFCSIVMDKHKRNQRASQLLWTHYSRSDKQLPEEHAFIMIPFIFNLMASARLHHHSSIKAATTIL